MPSRIYGLSILMAVSACATARIIDADTESPGGAIQLGQRRMMGDKAAYYVSTRVYAGVDLATALTEPRGCTVMRRRDRQQRAIGAVTASRGSDTLAALKADSEMKYKTVDSDHQPMAWSPGDTLTITIQGDASPPVAASVVAPDSIDHLTIAGRSDARTLSIQQPLEVTWAPGAGDLVDVEVMSFDAHGELDLLMCHAPDTGKLSVPRGALSQLRGKDGTITITRIHAKTVHVGQIPIAVIARNTVEFSPVALVR